MEKSNSQRLLSLDVLRGFTIAGMMLVNNPGSWSHVYAPLGHAQWNGLTLSDLVFPFFIFIMGCSMYFSFKKFDFRFSSDAFWKLTRRSVLLFAIGLALAWLSLSMRTFNSAEATSLSFFERLYFATTNFEHLRILGVLQRLALVSFFGTLLILLIRPKFIPYIIALILIIYWLIIHMTNSYEMNEQSIVAVVDRAILGINHMYYDTTLTGERIAFDPEGILSTLPSIAHVLVGFWAGKIISDNKDLTFKIQGLFIFGTILLFLGFLFEYGFGLNKKIWSSTFVLVTSGLAAQFLALLLWIIDGKGHKKWASFFESFGVNPMIIFVFGSASSILISNIGFQYNGVFTSIKSFLYHHMMQPHLGDYFGSFVFAVAFMFVCWVFGNMLYKRKIFIKL